MRVARRVRATRAEGPHLRYALWVQGCRLRCADCCNPGFFSASGGEEVSEAELAAQIEGAKRELGVEGVTLVGGEPLEQIDAVQRLCRAVQEMGLGVILFSGYAMAAARRMAGFEALWTAVDTLVDGPFERDRIEPSGGRRLVGSTNQRVIHRTTRYADPELWRGPALSEVRIDPSGQVSMVGAPAQIARLLSQDTLKR